MSRSRLLALGDDELLRECDFDRYRGSGAGGQKRNKTSSAVRLRHHGTGLSAQAEDSRSQTDNKRRALKRLRARIALELREAVAPAVELDKLRASAFSPGPKRRTDDYWRGVAAVLDVIAAHKGSISAAAGELGTTTSALVKYLSAEELVIRQVNEMRRGHGLKPIGAR